MVYKIEKEDNQFYVYEIDEYKNTLAFIGVFNTEAEAKKIIEKDKMRTDIYNMNIITNYKG